MNHQNNTGPAAEAGHLGFAISRLPTPKRNQLPLSKKTLKARIDALANAMPGTKLEAAFVGAPGESDLVWAVQLLDGLSMQFTQVLFKQYVRRRKDGTARNCRSANIWLRERVKWVRSLVMALPVDAQHLRDDDGRKRVAHQFANQTAAIWKNIEQNAAGEQIGRAHV